MQQFERKYNVIASSPPQHSHLQLGQSQHQQGTSQQQQMPYQHHAQDQHDGQQQTILQQGQASLYGNMMQPNSMYNGQENQTSPVAFQWPPNNSNQQQHRGMIGNGSNGTLSFSPGLYYDSSQNDAEIEAILSNYQPKLYANMQSFGGDTFSNSMNSEASLQQVGFMSQQYDNQAGNAGDNEALAAAALANYGNFNYGVGKDNAGRSSSNMNLNNLKNQQSNMSQWNDIQRSTFGSDSNASGLDYQKSYNMDGYKSSMGAANSKRNVAYDADASNTSSTQTPGGVSSSDDSTGSKRVRTTAGGSLEAAEQQNRFEAGLSTGGQDGKGASAAQSNVGGSRPIMQHHGTSTIDSCTLEKMAKESLQRAGKDNARGITKVNQINRMSPTKPVNRQRRSNSSSQIAGPSIIQNAVESGPSNMHKKNSQSVSHSISSGPYQSSVAMSGGGGGGDGGGGGFPASHPPGLGSQVLRGVTDAANNGYNAATEFTRRKGWPTRIVEELLDFVHVLDRQGKVLFASPSILTLTGWRADELKGKDLTDFVHPDDCASVRLEFQRSLAEKTEMTMYYRFQRKPQTAADKQRVHDQREAQQINRSRSGSTSGNDSSSALDSGNNNSNRSNKNMKTSTFAIGASDNHLAGSGLGTLEEEGGFQDDQREKYVIFEATGHPYYSNEDLHPEFDLNQELVEEILPKTIASSRSQKSKKPTSSPISIKKESPNISIDSTKEAKETKVGVLDKGGGGEVNDIQCFFCSCRIYPTKNVGMLDSFLELKLENERLRMLLSELSMSDGPAPSNGFKNVDAGSDGRRSLDEGPVGYHLDYLNNMTDSQQQHHLHGNMVGGSILPSNAGRNSMGSSYATDGGKDGNRRESTKSGSGSQMSLPTSPNISHAFERALTEGGTNVVGVGGDDSDDNGESSAMTADEKKKKKKSKSEEGDYVCTDCGRVDSPEWRKGPLGPKTLCNACGLRWAKKVKRNGGDPNAIAMAAKPAKGQIQAQGAAARAQEESQQNQQQPSETGNSYHSVYSTSLASRGNSNHPSMNHNNNSEYSSSHSPPNTYDTQSFRIYGDPSNMGQLTSDQNFLQSGGIPYDQSTLHIDSNLTNYTNHMQ